MMLKLQLALQKLSESQSKNYVTTDGQSAGLSWCRAPFAVQYQIFVTVRQLRVCWCGATSLKRGWIRRLQFLLVLASPVILRSLSGSTNDHILLYQIRDSTNLEVQVPVFISPTNRVTQLYPQPLGSFRRFLRLAGLRWRYSNPPPNERLQTQFLLNNI
jgi:hypothetical protein